MVSAGSVKTVVQKLGLVKLFSARVTIPAQSCRWVSREHRECDARDFLLLILLAHNASELEDSCGVFTEEQLALGGCHIHLIQKMHRPFVPHVQAIVAADHDAVGAYFADHELHD